MTKTEAWIVKTLYSLIRLLLLGSSDDRRRGLLTMAKEIEAEFHESVWN